MADSQRGNGWMEAVTSTKGCPLPTYHSFRHASIGVGHVQQHGKLCHCYNMVAWIRHAQWQHWASNMEEGSFTRSHTYMKSYRGLMAKREILSKNEASDSLPSPKWSVVNTNTHTYRQAHEHTHTHARTYKYTHAYIYIYTQRCTHTYAYMWRGHRRVEVGKEVGGNDAGTVNTSTQVWSWKIV